LHTPQVNYSSAFPVTITKTSQGQGGIQAGHFCDPAKAAAASGLVDRSTVFRSLQDKLPMLIKQKVNSWTGSNTHLVALRLSRPQEETIKLANPVDP
jgi:hypothetical protein